MLNLRRSSCLLKCSGMFKIFLFAGCKWVINQKWACFVLFRKIIKDHGDMSSKRFR